MAKIAVIASVLVLLTLACAAPTKIRAGHAVPNAGPVDVYVDGNLVISSLAFGTVTDYTSLESGEHVFSIAASNTTLLTQNITVSARPTTLLVVGLLVENSTAPVHFLPFVDDNSAPADASSARLKFVHASPETSPVEVFVDGTLAFGATSYGGVTTYAVVPAGQHNITVRVNANTSLEVTDLTLAGGNVYTIFAEGVLHPNNDTQGIRAVAIQDAAYTYFKVRVAHTVANAPVVNIFLRDDAANTTVEFTNVSYKQFSNYVTAVNGSYTVTVLNGEQVVFTTTPDWSGAGSEATLAVVGRTDVPANNTEYLNAVVFNDDNSTPASGVARVKFVHTSPGAPAVDVYANGNALFTGIAYQSQSQYTNVPAGYYHVQVKAGAAVALNVAGIEFVAGQVYSIYAEGWLTGNDTHALTAVANVDAVYQFVTFRIVTAVNDATGATPVNVALNGNSLGDFAATSINEYVVQVVPTAYQFDVTISGTKHTFNTPLTAGVYQSVLIAGRAKENTTFPVTLTVIQDDVSFPQAGNLLKSKFIHASPGAPAVDLKVNGELMVTNVAYLQSKVATWTETVGPVNISIYVTGTETLVYSVVLTQSYLFGGIETVVAYGLVGENSTQPFGINYQTDFNWNYSPVRVAHLVSDAPAVDLSFYNGATLIKSFTMVNYNTISQYVQLPILTSVTAVLTAGTTIVLVQPITYDSTNPATIAALGFLNNISFYSFEDDNSAPASSLEGRVRIIHAVPNAPAVNVNFNDLQVFTNAAFGVATAYQKFEVRNYRVDVYLVGSSHPVFSGFVSVTGGDVVTVILEGDATKPETLKVYPVQDAVYQYFRLRLVHAAPNAGTVDVLLDGTTAATGLQFTNITAFLDLPWTAEAKQVSVVTAGNNTVLEGSFTFAVNKDVTVAVAGNAPNVTYSFVEIPNDYVVPPNGATFATVQFAHLVALAPGVDVYLNHTKIAENVTYSHRSQYQQNIPTGELDVEVRVAGTNDTIYQTKVTLVAEQVYTIYAVGVAGVEVFAIVSNDYAPLPEFKIRVLHTSYDSGDLDVLVGNQLFFNKVVYRHVTDYSALNEGHYDLVVRPYDNVTYSLFNISQANLKENMDYTFLLGGVVQVTNETLTDKFTGIVLVDDNTLPPEGKISVRFIHAVVGYSHVDLKFGSEVVFRNVSFLQASNYSIHDAAAIAITVVETGTDNSIMPTATFDLKTTTSAVYTIVASGYPYFVAVDTYLDNGGSPPPQTSSSSKHHGLTGLQIGLIIGGVALFVILVAGVAFVIYTKRRQLRGYSEIPSNKE